MSELLKSYGKSRKGGDTRIWRLKDGRYLSVENHYSLSFRLGRLINKPGARMKVDVWPEGWYGNVTQREIWLWKVNNNKVHERTKIPVDLDCQKQWEHAKEDPEGWLYGLLLEAML